MSLTVVIWDVQHGSAAYIRTPNDTHIVVDLGTGSYKENAPFSPLCHLKDKWGVRQLDGVIITHPHADHIQDILNWDYVRPRVLLRPSHLSEEDIWNANPEADADLISKYLEISKEYRESVKSDSNPFNANVNGGVSIDSFFPRESSRSNLNNHSIVTVLEYQGIKITIPGDNGSPSWRELLKSRIFTEAVKGTDVFVASHHGRESGFSSDLFDVFRPRLTIISDGPAGETSATSRYSTVSRGWRVYRRSGGSEERKCVTTRKDGVIVVECGRNSDGRPFLHVKID